MRMIQELLSNAAYLHCIETAMDRFGYKTLHFSGYDRQEDMFHFKQDGYVVYVLGIDSVNAHEGKINLIVDSERYGDIVTYTPDLASFSPEILHSLAVEVYDYICDAESEDVEDFIKEHFANFLDTFGTDFE